MHTHINHISLILMCSIQQVNRVDIHVLARQMGTSIGMLEKHYSHLIQSLATKQVRGEEDEII